MLREVESVAAPAHCAVSRDGQSTSRSHIIDVLCHRGRLIRQCRMPTDHRVLVVGGNRSTLSPCVAYGSMLVLRICSTPGLMTDRLTSVQIILSTAAHGAPTSASVGRSSHRT